MVEEEEEIVVHEDNDWGISLVSEDAGEAESAGPALVAGISVAYTVPAHAATAEENTVESTDTSLEELMKQMKSM